MAMQAENGAAGPALDPLTAASVTLCWVIALNKPFYPLYVWYLTGEGVLVSTLTMVAGLGFAGLALAARQLPLATRFGLPFLGICDTVLAGKIFGQAAGTELFLAPCVMLAALSFESREVWWQRGLAAFSFLAFVLFHGRSGQPLYGWSEAHLQSLFSLNAFSVACLMSFIAIRYAGVKKG